MTPRRFASIAAALVVAGIAALASYAHMRGLAVRYGQTEVIADLLPVSVDGMMVVATLALGDGRRHRWSAWLAFWIGVAASVIANVLAAESSAIARCISAWPAIAFLLVVEVITRGGRIRVREVDTQPVSAPVPADTTPATPAEPKRTSARPAGRPETRTTGRPSAAAKVAKIAAKYPDETPAQIAKRARVSTKTVNRHLPDRTPATAADKTPDTSADAQPVNGHAVDLITTT